MEIKLRLYEHCMEYVKQHIEINTHAVAEAQQAVNGETKNTAGDRYETERAMKQRETELFGKRIDDAIKQYQMLETIDASKLVDSVMPGALVSTSIGSFFIAISTDEVIIDDEEYCIISTESPIGQAMAGKRKSESFSFRGKQISIHDIC